MNRTTVFLILIPFVLCHISEKPRHCCMYSSKLSEDFCPSNKSCSIRQSSTEEKLSNSYVFPKKEQCQIVSDSKKVKTNVQECFNADFSTIDSKTQSILDQVMVKAYKLSDNTFGENGEIFGLEVLIPYSKSEKWNTARFRLSNNQGCDEHCSPRCVTIQRKGIGTKTFLKGFECFINKAKGYF